MTVTFATTISLCPVTPAVERSDSILDAVLKTKIEFNSLTSVRLPVSVLAADISTIVDELPLDGQKPFLLSQRRSYLFDLSSIGYHYVNICKLKRNWKTLCSDV